MTATGSSPTRSWRSVRTKAILEVDFPAKLQAVIQNTSNGDAQMPRATSTQDILIQTERPGEARSFYKDVLGFPVVHDDPAMCGLDTGTFRLFIDPAPALGPVLEIEVDDLAAMKDRLLTAGCEVIEENASIPRCYLRDPFGLVFNLRQRV